MEDQYQKYVQIVRLWIQLDRSGKFPEQSLAGLVYYALADEVAPPEVEAITYPMDLCEYFSQRDVGRPLSIEEKTAIFVTITEEVRQAKSVSIRMHIMLMLPNVLLVLAIFVVVFKTFSWWVICMAIAAKVEFGFARYLAGKGHPAAGLHVPISMLLILASLVVSLVHLFGVYTFH